MAEMSEAGYKRGYRPEDEGTEASFVEETALVAISLQQLQEEAEEPSYKGISSFSTQALYVP